MLFVVGCFFLESVFHKDIDNDGMVAGKWTEEVINSKGMTPGKTYYGIGQFRTTASDSYKERINLCISLNHDHSIEVTISKYPYDKFTGEWDYFVQDPLVSGKNS